MPEFRPDPRPSMWRIPLVLVIALVVIVPIGPLWVLYSGDFQVRYTVLDGTLTVDSGDPFTSVRSAPLSAIRESFATDLGRGRRVAGTSMKGCCTGTWTFAELGKVWLATSCAHRGVFLRVQGEDLPWVLSPPDPEGFVAALRRGEPLDIALPPADKGPIELLALVLLPLALLGGPALMAAMLLGPGKIRYEVGPGWLEVRTIYSRRRYAAHGLRARRMRPQRSRRVAGMAMPGYYTGWFQVDGARARVAATRLDEVVLIEGEARLVLSPADPEAFLAALRKVGVQTG
ncbi:MAG: PH domain-containing protein [Pseudomonadota bacterium]